MEDATMIDARGLLCPLPVLKARKALMALPSGACLRLLTDDPAALIDLPHFCAEAGHLLVEWLDLGDHQSFLLRKGG